MGSDVALEEHSLRWALTFHPGTQLSFSQGVISCGVRVGARKATSNTHRHTYMYTHTLTQRQSPVLANDPCTRCTLTEEGVEAFN